MKKTAIGSKKYAYYSTTDLLKAYKDGPQRIRQSIEGLSVEELKSKVINDKWSIAEILIHLADADIIGSCRIRQAFTEHPGPLPFYKEADWAVKLNYQDQPVEHLNSNLFLFELLRKTTAVIFDNCTETDWKKTGLHPERGEMTLRELLELYADHSERHIEQILERRKLLGKAIKLEVILKDRLY
jgi:uncharacterized damage-inducible protein DinB